jgi:hypothetical protein
VIKCILTCVGDSIEVLEGAVTELASIWTRPILYATMGPMELVGLDQYINDLYWSETLNEAANANR